MPQAIEIWPVYGFKAGEYFHKERVAEFFTWGDAADFAMRPEDFGGERRNLYMAPSRMVKGNRAHVVK